MKDEKQNQIIETETEPEKVNPITIYQNNIYALVDDVKQESQFSGLTDEELKNNKAFFPTLIDYIYNNYIGDLLGNKKGKVVVYNNIDLIDDLFNIYIDLIYKYKWNNKPFIVEFSTFVNINKDTIYSWLNGEYNRTIDDLNDEGATRHTSDVVRKWFNICERELLNGSDTIRDIFILKAKHGYRDNNNDINITVNHKQIINADDLPALIDLKTT